MNYAREIDTPLGVIVVTGGNQALLKKYERNIKNYFTGKKLDLTFYDFEISGTAFQKKVLETLFNVPFGKTVSYGELARLSGYPKATRAVASVVAQNKFYIVIPCHRVVRNDGSIGQYGAGVDRKKWLLDHERMVNNK